MRIACRSVPQSGSVRASPPRRFRRWRSAAGTPASALSVPWRADDRRHDQMRVENAGQRHPHPRDALDHQGIGATGQAEATIFRRDRGAEQAELPASARRSRPDRCRPPPARGHASRRRASGNCLDGVASILTFVTAVAAAPRVQHRCRGQGQSPSPFLTWRRLRITLPNSAQVLPVQRCSCMARIGWKLVGLVLTLIPGSKRARVEILQIGGLLHDVLAREVVAALGQDLVHRLADAEGEHVAAIGKIGASAYSWP